MKRFVLLMGILLAGCSVFQPAPTATPTPTNTPVPTVTPTSTPTRNPCPDTGWDDIATYTRQFNRYFKESKSGDNIAAFISVLTNTKDKIAEVKIAPCTEYARQTILKGLNAEILGFYAMFIEKDETKFIDQLKIGATDLANAYKELQKYGINVELLE